MMERGLGETNGTPMDCHRCHGCLVFSQFHDHERVFVGGRCLNCGNVIDAMLLLNRRSPLPIGWQKEDRPHSTKRGSRRTYGKTSGYDLRGVTV